MKLIFTILTAALSLALSGCGSVTYERARFDGNRVSNPTLGRGAYYQIPATYSVLNPYSPVPTTRENAGFEGYLRGFAIQNDQVQTKHSFHETVLFRGENRYLVIYHVSLNLPRTFKRMHPGSRTLLMPEIAKSSYRYFGVPQSDFDFSFGQIAGRSVINYKPFRLDAAGEAGTGWRGIGCTLVGDVTDVMDIHLFARDADLAAAEQDLRSILENFSYGKPQP